MNMTTRLLIAYVLIVLMGLGLSLMTFINGQQVTQVSTELVEEKLPRLAIIQKIHVAIVEHERLMYEYYATIDSQRFSPLLAANEARLQMYFQEIVQAFPQAQVLEEIRYGDRMVRDLTQQLDDTLSAEQVDWDKARSLLAMVSQTGQKLFPLLDDLVAQVNREAIESGQSTRMWTEQTTHLVSFFSLLVLVIAGLVAFYVSRYIREANIRRRLAMFAERSPNPILSFSDVGELLYANPASEQLAKDLAVHEGLAEAGVSNLISDDFAGILTGLKQSQQHYTQWISQPGDDCVLQYSLSLLSDLNAAHLYIEDISERTRAQRELLFQANHNELTELKNRRKFNDNLAAIVERAQPASLLLIQIDRFERLTGSVGYRAGDELIQAVAKQLRQFVDGFCSVPLQQKLYHLNPQKFALLLDEWPSSASPQIFAVSLANNLRAHMKQTLCVQGREFHLTVSIAISCLHAHANEVETGQAAESKQTHSDRTDNGEALLANADTALTQLQRDGGDGVLAYSAQLHADEQAWLDIENQLRDAISRDELVLFYQPKIQSNAHRISGVEALIRWRRADGSMVSPGQFIPVAEQSGLIVQIGEWVMHQACQQFERWADRGCATNIAVNISARQFRHPGFLPMMEQCLSDYRIEPAMIELEITESLLMNDISQSIETMKQLKKLGYKLSIDDFGTGYSSLSYLKDFPIDKLKIDRAFVMDIDSNDDDKTLVKTIVDLAHNLNLTVVAEGVETEQQLGIVESLGCEEIQGFYFSQPVEAGVISEQYLMLPADAEA